MSPEDKDIVWLKGEVKSPPFTKAGRTETGVFLRRLQRGFTLTMPYSRPMPSIGPRCHELRIRDEQHNWRVIYRIDAEAILVVDIFAKKTQQTPDHVIDACSRRLRLYDMSKEKLR